MRDGIGGEDAEERSSCGEMGWDVAFERWWGACRLYTREGDLHFPEGELTHLP